MPGIDLDGFEFTLLKNHDEWLKWGKEVCLPDACSKPDVYPCLARNIADSEDYDTQIYLGIGDLRAAVQFMEAN